MPVTAEGQELPYAGTPEMDALLQQINQNPETLSVVGQQPALLAEIMKHVGLNVNEQQLRDIVDTWPDEAAERSMQSEEPTADEEVEGDVEAEQVASAPPSPDEDEQGYDEFTKPPEGGVPADDEEGEAQAAMPPSRSSPMPRSRGGNPIDDLISAQMMQSAVGNPNAPVPTGMQVGRQQRPAIPQSRMPPGGNPQQQMIAEIFRNQARGGGKPKKKANA